MRLPIHQGPGVDRRTSGDPAVGRALPGAAGWLILLLLYLGLSVAVLGRTWFAPGPSIAGGLGDTGEFVWYLAWMPHAVAHGLNPLFTNHQPYPVGAKLIMN